MTTLILTGSATGFGPALALALLALFATLALALASSLALAVAFAPAARPRYSLTTHRTARRYGRQHWSA